jgi:Zn-dependent protease
VENGYLKIATLRGAPVRVHWSTPLGALLFSGFRYAPGAWAGFLAIVLAHEIGHALLALRYRVRVHGIDVHALGGQCRLANGATRRQRIVIAWGGVLAQALLLALAVLVLRPAASTPFTVGLAETLVGTNLWLIALNLLPVAPLDGRLRAIGSRERALDRCAPMSRGRSASWRRRTPASRSFAPRTRSACAARSKRRPAFSRSAPGSPG